MHQTWKTFRFISANKIFMQSQFLSYVWVHCRCCRHSSVESSVFPLALFSRPVGRLVRSGGLFVFFRRFLCFSHTYTRAAFDIQFSHLTVFYFMRAYETHTNANGLFVCPSSMSRQITKFYLLRPFFAFIFMYSPTHAMNDCWACRTPRKSYELTGWLVECRFSLYSTFFF